MKRIVNVVLLLIAGIFTFFGSFAQTINFQENFDGSSVTTPPSGWTVNVVAGNSGTDVWHFDNPGNRDFGLSISGGNFAVFDNANYGTNSSKEVELISPVINLGAQTLTTLGFYEYFETGFSGQGEVFFSANNGGTYTSVYTVNAASIANPDKITIDLQPLLIAATPPYNCKVKFIWTSPDNSAFWWIIDDVMLYNNVAKDAAAIKVEDLPEGCLVSLTTPVTVTIKNLGNGNIQILNVNYKLNNDSIITDTLDFGTLIGGPLLVDSSYTHTFDSLLELDEGGNDLQAWSSNPDGNADQFPLNDTVFYSTSVKRLAVADLPFYDGFEDTVFGSAWCPKPGPSGNGRIRLVDNSIVAVCTDSQMVAMDSEAGKSSIDALDLLVNLSSCVEKNLSFTYGNKNDNTDAEDALYISVDNGASYQKIFSFDLTASNDTCLDVSFNLDSVANAMGISLSANSLLRWRHAANDAIESGNDGLYIDEVRIDFLNLQPVDAALAGIVSPPDTIVTLDTIDVIIKITNLSPDTLVGSDVSYQYGTDPVVTEFWGGCLGQNDTAVFTFGTALAPVSLGEELCVWIEMPNNQADLDSSNNTVCLLSTTNVQEASGSMSYNAYPNPATDRLTIEFYLNAPAETQIKMFNIIGKEVYAEEMGMQPAGVHRTMVNIDKLPDGIYFYQIKTNAILTNAKLIIIH